MQLATLARPHDDFIFSDQLMHQLRKRMAALNPDQLAYVCEVSVDGGRGEGIAKCFAHKPMWASVDARAHSYVPVCALALLCSAVGVPQGWPQAAIKAGPGKSACAQAVRGHGPALHGAGGQAG